MLSGSVWKEEYFRCAAEPLGYTDLHITSSSLGKCVLAFSAWGSRTHPRAVTCSCGEIVPSTVHKVSYHTQQAELLTQSQLSIFNQFILIYINCIKGHFHLMSWPNIYFTPSLVLWRMSSRWKVKIAAVWRAVPHPCCCRLCQNDKKLSLPDSWCPPTKTHLRKIKHNVHNACQQHLVADKARSPGVKEKPGKMESGDE